MSAAAGGLKELHRLHLRLEEVRKELDRGPRQIKAARSRIEKRERDIAEMRERLTQLKMSADSKSLQLKTNESKIAELKARLNAAKTNKEFEVIKSQIDADTMANSVLEDEILEVYEKVDQLQTQLAEVEQARDEARQDEARIRGEVEATAPDLRVKASELEQALADAEKQLPEQVAATYRRLAAAHGSEALAAVDNQACGVCHATISPNSLVELKSGKFVFCGSCGRLLFRDEAE